ncbi:MAG: hypothetical protein L0G89_07250 [Janibacter sp.]|nr:hypothetical protein [Janibacter sp.]
MTKNVVTHTGQEALAPLVDQEHARLLGMIPAGETWVALGSGPYTRERPALLLVTTEGYRHQEGDRTVPWHKAPDARLHRAWRPVGTEPSSALAERPAR